jgi:choline dehydrogenase-like flavoprotein
MKDKKGYWPRGHVLGGSGSINVLQYTRGSRFDFDEWAANGCTGWSYKEVLPYFLKSEDMQIPEFRNSIYHNEGGEIAVSEADISRLSKIFRNAGEELGYKIRDYNGELQEGFNKIQFNIRKGVRSSAAIEFLKRKKNNLHIITESHATKVVLENKKAVGVNFIQDGRKRYVKARKEIILSAGAINTPQILMLSGFGPKEHLEKLGIPVEKDLPVGNNLQDHQQVSVCTKTKTQDSITPERLKSIWSKIQYYLFGTGPRSIAGSDGSAFLHLDSNNEGKIYPDIQMVLFPTLFGKNLFNYNNEVAKEILASPSEHGFCVFVALTHPRSRGTIRLQAKDPFDYPLIDPRYFHNQRDVDNLIGGVRILEKLLETRAFKEVGVDINFMKKTFCSQHRFRSDKYWECMIRSTAFTQFHPTSSCKMGPLDRHDTVVDPQLRVKGVAGLRVVDASIFPNITSGNTNAPTIMVAEKAADLIRGKITVNHLKRSL